MPKRLILRQVSDRFFRQVVAGADVHNCWPTLKLLEHFPAIEASESLEQPLRQHAAHNPIRLIHDLVNPKLGDHAKKSVGLMRSNA